MLSLMPDKGYGDLHMTNDFFSINFLFGCLFISLLIFLSGKLSACVLQDLMKLTSEHLVDQ